MPKAGRQSAIFSQVVVMAKRGRLTSARPWVVFSWQAYQSAVANTASRLSVSWGITIIML